jgi:hypothetical protein
MIKIQTKKIINVDDWDYLVERTYGRPYTFQQQDGCKERGNANINIPNSEAYDYKNNSIQ